MPFKYYGLGTLE